MIGDIILPPGLALILAGLLLPLLKGQARNTLLIAAPLVALFLVWQLPNGNHLTISYLNFELVLVRADELSRLFATVFTVMAAAGGLYAMNQTKVSELAAAFVYAGSAISVVFAGDLISLFIFWEIMAIASSIIVWSGGTSARAAGQRYVAVHFMGGVLLMAGIAGEYMQNGSIAFDMMEANSWPRWLILAGFLINAGAPPFSAWLPDAYPASSWSGAVFLSAFTTKTAVYVLIRTFPGAEALIYIGLYMVFYGIIFAILENDIRRVFSYSIISQVGFMVIAIGIGSDMALNGAAAHAFVHIIYKALLLMSIGAVLYQTGKTKCTELGGLFRTMPITMICGVIGALSISAFPFTSGYITKSLISQSAAEAHLGYVWFGLTAASASAFLYIGIKFPWFVFFSKDSGLRPAEPPKSMRYSMYFLSFVCIGLGVFPDLLYSLLPYPIDYSPYKLGKILSQIQLLLFAGLAFFLLLPLLKNTFTITLDFDWFYRGLGNILRKEFDSATGAIWSNLSRACASIAKMANVAVYKLHGPGGIFAETWPTGLMALWTTVLLGLYLAVYFL
ncbi:MAG: Na(+)/H(+) antiporter subunit D [Hyphomicrobiales bacterium]